MRNHSSESSFTSGKTRGGEVLVQRSQHDNPHEGDYHRARRNFRHQGASEQSHDPDVWLVGISLIIDVDPEKLKGVNITKEAATTI